eukprot:m.357029 g.357029  ORF g.357029 m.357029 type:complete len:309 (+) comp17686_c0_seq1:495-1421(+)
MMSLFAPLLRRAAVAMHSPVLLRAKGLPVVSRELVQGAKRVLGGPLVRQASTMRSSMCCTHGTSAPMSTGLARLMSKHSLQPQGAAIIRAVRFHGTYISKGKLVSTPNDPTAWRWLRFALIATGVVTWVMVVVGALSDDSDSDPMLDEEVAEALGNFDFEGMMRTEAAKMAEYYNISLVGTHMLEFQRKFMALEGAKKKLLTSYALVPYIGRLQGFDALFDCPYPDPFAEEQSHIEHEVEWRVPLLASGTTDMAVIWLRFAQTEAKQWELIAVNVRVATLGDAKTIDVDIQEPSSSSKSSSSSTKTKC